MTTLTPTTLRERIEFWTKTRDNAISEEVRTLAALRVAELELQERYRL